MCKYCCNQSESFKIEGTKKCYKADSYIGVIAEVEEQPRIYIQDFLNEIFYININYCPFCGRRFGDISITFEKDENGNLKYNIKKVR